MHKKLIPWFWIFIQIINIYRIRWLNVLQVYCNSIRTTDSYSNKMYIACVIVQCTWAFWALEKPFSILEVLKQLIRKRKSSLLVTISSITSKKVWQKKYTLVHIQQFAQDFCESENVNSKCMHKLMSCNISNMVTSSTILSWKQTVSVDWQ